MHCKTKIIHVEDDHDILEIAKISLMLSDKIEIQQFSSPSAALQFAKHNAADVLLLDMIMPEMSGDALLKELRKLTLHENTPAIFMTARARHDEQQALMGSGAVSVIVKPFDPMTLAEQILQALAGLDEYHLPFSSGTDSANSKILNKSLTDG